MNRIGMVLSVVLVFAGATVADDTSLSEITVMLPGGATMEMVWIPSGTFMMGAPESDTLRSVDEIPQHEVTITRGFYFGKYELTQEQWESVMGTRPWEGRDWVQDHPENPAAMISWDDVQAFIVTLNAAEGSNAYRLPTEAEWEYACRAGTATWWSFGDDEEQLGEYMWYYDNAWEKKEEYAHPVGTKLPNPWGLHDMHGNVWEWVQDWYDRDYYQVSPKEDPPGPESGSGRVIRGGSFGDLARGVRAAYRHGRMPGARYADIGVRLMRAAPSPGAVSPSSWGEIKEGFRR